MTYDAFMSPRGVNYQSLKYSQVSINKRVKQLSPPIVDVTLYYYKTNCKNRPLQRSPTLQPARCWKP